jgi:hypothetical protein
MGSLESLHSVTVVNALPPNLVTVAKRGQNETPHQDPMLQNDTIADALVTLPESKQVSCLNATWGTRTPVRYQRL